LIQSAGRATSSSRQDQNTAHYVRSHPSAHTEGPREYPHAKRLTLLGRRCVSKMDHHCVWINNCVGHSNTRHFFAFIVSTTVTLWYGAYLTGSIITQFLHSELPPDVPVSSLSWGVYLRLWLVRACFPSYFLSYPIHQSIITPFGQGLFLGPLILSPPPPQLSLSAAPSSRWPTRSTASNSSPASSPAEKIAQS